jgi:hypothetical protein
MAGGNRRPAIAATAIAGGSGRRIGGPQGAAGFGSNTAGTDAGRHRRTLPIFHWDARRLRE